MGLLVSVLVSRLCHVCQSKVVQPAKNNDTIMVRSLSFNGKNVEATLRSVSFKETDRGTTMFPSEASGHVIIERSPSFKNWEADEFNHETTVSIKHENMVNENSGVPISSKLPSNFAGLKVKPPKRSTTATALKSPNELDTAATKLQKVYKSYRTRRNLADCAVVVEELWWKALDFAALKRSSISYYTIERPETAISRWSRARTRAAKVGKGLSKDDKAQKLALQHWLEAIDPRHRYGHNLHLYYDIWFESESSQPFFYWLDIGDGKEINVERCPRNVLQSQCIKYLAPKEREAYEVIVEDGKLVFRKNGELVNTCEGSKWIFVLSTTRMLYIGQKKKGLFQHSSFLAGGATVSAGRLVAESGILKAIWPYSGHYLPTEDNFQEFVSFLEEREVDLRNVKKCATDDDSVSFGILGSDHQDVQEPSTLIEKTNACNVHGPTEADGELLNRNNGDGEEVTQDIDRPIMCKWATGAGPRIGCVRDYPTELQCMALEKVNLSPRVTPLTVDVRTPIPSPRPSPTIRLSPRLAYMGIPSPRFANLQA